MSIICVVDAARGEPYGSLEFERLDATAQAFLVDRLGAQTGYRAEQHFPDHAPGILAGKALPTLDEAKAQAENMRKEKGGRFYWDQPTNFENALIKGIVCVLRIGEPPGPDEPWQLWYKDLFDLDSPAEMVVKGEGLVGGLTELWARYLEEGIRGLSRFTLLYRSQAQQIEIAGRHIEAAHTVRRWVFGTKEAHQHVDRRAANAHLLKSLATSHAKLILTGRPMDPILDLAFSAPDSSDFALGLAALAEQA